MRSDARANREAILAAATEQLASDGVDASLTAVAERAGVGIATLYRNFPSRQDLIRAVLDDLEQRMLEIIEKALARIEADPQAAWLTFVNDTARLRSGALLPAFAAAFVAQGELPRQLTEHRKRLLDAIQAVLDRAQAAGLVRSDLTAVRFQLGIASITRPLPGAALVEPTDQETWMIEVFIQGLGP